MSDATRAEKALDKAALAYAAQLDRAVAAARKHLSACRALGQGANAADDGRLLLIESMGEYAGYLQSRHGKKP